MASDNDSDTSSVRGSDFELSDVDFGVDDHRSFSSHDSDESELRTIAGSLQDMDDDESRGPPEDNSSEPLLSQPPENIEFSTHDAENSKDDEPDLPDAKTPHSTIN